MRKLYYFFLVFALLLPVFFSGCLNLPKDVIMPEWDVDLNVPLTNKTYLLDDIIKATNYVTIDTAQNYLYIVTSDKFEHVVSVSNFIKATDTSSNLNNTVGSNNEQTELFLNFPEGAKVKSAIFSQGKVKIIARNPSALGSVTLSVKFPGIKPVGSSTPLSISVTIPANSSRTEEKDLSGYTYDQPINQSIDGEFWVQATGSSSVPNVGNISFDVFSSSFMFSRVTGYLRPRLLGHKEQSFTLNIGSDAPKYRDKIKLKEASLTLTGDYLSTVSDPFPVRLKNVQMIGRRKDGQYLPLTFNDGNSTIDFTNKNFSRIYTQDNSNILSFIEFMPDSVFLSADYYMNDNDDHTYKTATSSDSVKFNAFFQAKNILAIKQTTMENTESLDFKPDDRTTIEKGQGASVTFQIKNSIPLNAWIKLTLTDVNKVPLFVATSTAGTGDTILVKAANIDNNGNVTTPGLTDLTLTLNADQINKLSRAYYALLSVTVQTAGYNDVNPPKFPIHSTDWISVKTYGSVKYRVQEDKK